MMTVCRSIHFYAPLILSKLYQNDVHGPALILASELGHLEIVQYLLSSPRIDINRRNDVSHYHHLHKWVYLNRLSD